MTACLTDIPLNSKGMILSVNKTNKHLIAKLLALGIYPGQVVTVHRKFPQIVLSINNTLISFDKQIASQIKVNIIN